MHHVFAHLHRDDYQQILEKQGHRCKICGVEASKLPKRLHIDHDHITGEVRGLLCHACNLGLGYFRDNTANLWSAIAYLDTCGTGLFLSETPIKYNKSVKVENLDGVEVIIGKDDWRLLDEQDTENIKRLNVQVLRKMYGISKATAYLWKSKCV